MPFMERLKLAWRVLIDSNFAAKVEDGLKALEAKAVKVVVPPERQHASGLMLIAALQREGRTVSLTVADTGAGFATQVSALECELPRWGLLSMHERAQAVGGILHIESVPGRGTTVLVRVELPA